MDDGALRTPEPLREGDDESLPLCVMMLVVVVVLVLMLLLEVAASLAGRRAGGEATRSAGQAH